MFKLNTSIYNKQNIVILTFALTSGSSLMVNLGMTECALRVSIETGRTVSYTYKQKTTPNSVDWENLQYEDAVYCMQHRS